ncbi:MAG: hypothetical protein LAO55_05765 [Acidobacteriia bacterium]|nr:hypothetical protein [Terriglobia bacterium]
MSPKVRHALSVCFGILLIAGIGYGTLAAARTTILALASMKSDIVVAIIAAAATVFVSVLSIVLGKIYESRSIIQKEHREKKIPVYEDLIRFTFRILMGSKTGESLSEKEMIVLMSEFTQRAMVWGSDEILGAWVKWRRLLTDDAAVKANPLKAMFLYEELIFTIRRDLGHKNKALVKGDILALFVNDIDQHLPLRRP